MCSVLHVEMGNQVAYVMQGVFVSRCECEYLISLCFVFFCCFFHVYLMLLLLQKKNGDLRDWRQLTTATLSAGGDD